MEECGLAIEAAVTRVQAAEVEAIAARRPAPFTPRKRARAAAALEAHGVDPVPWAYPVSRALSGDRTAASPDRLTPRELEVLRAFAVGLSYRRAGERLGISWRTVQSHATHLYRKLGVDGRAAALAEARRQRLIEPRGDLAE
jgi:DNA-binding CsgD family transcriptional regulator